MLATVRLACIKAAEGMSPVRRALSDAEMAAIVGYIDRTTVADCAEMAGVEHRIHHQAAPTEHIFFLSFDKRSAQWREGRRQDRDGGEETIDANFWVA